MLNARQQAFVNEYARGGFKNASEAAVKAGYSAKTADRIASRLLKNVEVRDAVEARREPAKERRLLTQHSFSNNSKILHSRVGRECQ